jgi:type II secretory pathway pseudopilin PulG
MIIRPARNPENGLTLVDVIMAIAILGIMASAVLGSFRYGFFIMQLARENQRATQILLAKVETIRLYNWDQVNSNGFIPQTFTEYYDPQGGSNSQGAVYNGRMDITPFPDNTSCRDSMRQLTVSLQWNTRSISHNRSLTTFIAQDGIQNYVY